MCNFKDRLWRKRFWAMNIGVVFIALGVALFKLSSMGNDPATAFNLALVDTFGIPLRIMNVLTCCIWFAIEILFGRDLIGPGTFINWFLIALYIEGWLKLIGSFYTPGESFGERFVILLIGMLFVTFSCALYQTANLGVSPYDALSIIIEKRLHFPYFWCRIFTDLCCVLGTFLLGGLLGVGTIVSVLGLGPFIAFFTNKVVLKYILKELKD